MKSVFRTLSSDSKIIVPEIPVGCRNNCQTGQWVIGNESYSSKGLKIKILDKNEYYGNFGNSGQNPPENVIWWQIWFVAVTGELPKNLVMVTYVKKDSLRNLSMLINSLQAQGNNPDNGLFCPSFKKEQKTLANGQAVSFFALQWEWEEQSKEELALFNIQEEDYTKFFDPTAESKLFPIKGLSQEEKQALFVKRNIEADFDLEESPRLVAAQE